MCHLVNDITMIRITLYMLVTVTIEQYGRTMIVVLFLIAKRRTLAKRGLCAYEKQGKRV